MMEDELKRDDGRRLVLYVWGWRHRATRVYSFQFSLSKREVSNHHYDSLTAFLSHIDPPKVDHHWPFFRYRRTVGRIDSLFVLS